MNGGNKKTRLLHGGKEYACLRLAEFLSCFSIHRLGFALPQGDFFQREASEGLEAALLACQKIPLPWDLLNALHVINHALNFIRIDDGVQISLHQALWKVFP